MAGGAGVSPPLSPPFSALRRRAEGAPDEKMKDHQAGRRSLKSPTFARILYGFCDFHASRVDIAEEKPYTVQYIQPLEREIHARCRICRGLSLSYSVLELEH